MRALSRVREPSVQLHTGAAAAMQKKTTPASKEALVGNDKSVSHVSAPEAVRRAEGNAFGVPTPDVDEAARLQALARSNAVPTAVSLRVGGNAEKKRERDGRDMDEVGNGGEQQRFSKKSKKDKRKNKKKYGRH